MELIIAIGVFVAAAVLGLILVLARGATRKKPSLPYRSVGSLLTPAERSFYGVIKSVLGDQYEIMCKVRLMDLLHVPGGTPEWQAHANRIMSKHVDFLLCDPSDFSPSLAIELDDSSHQQRRRKERDGFLDAAFDAAGLRLLHVTAKAQYSPAEIHSLIASTAEGHAE